MTCSLISLKQSMDTQNNNNNNKNLLPTKRIQYIGLTAYNGQAAGRVIPIFLATYTN